MKNDDDYPHPENWKDKDDYVDAWGALRLLFGMILVVATLVYIVWFLAWLAAGSI